VIFISCKANARVKLAKSGHGPHLLRFIVFCVVLVIVSCYRLYAVLLLLCCTVILLLCYYLCCLIYWLCVLYHCHRVLTQLQLTNISISISISLILLNQFLPSSILDKVLPIWHFWLLYIFSNIILPACL